jgi:hypothetical protein
VFPLRSKSLKKLSLRVFFSARHACRMAGAISMAQAAFDVPLAYAVKRG